MFWERPGYIPKSAKWYLAEIVQQITVEGDSRNVVHTNLVLVRADSPEDAYQKRWSWGLPESSPTKILMVSA
jgi:hypothetical protein